MTPALLALALAVADPLGFPAPPLAPPGAAAAPVQPAQPPAAAPAAPAATAVPTLRLPVAAGPGLDGLILPVSVLLALAIAGLVFSRRRRQAPRLVHVLETTSIGPKRALVVARVGDEVLVIGSSEAGLQLLAARPAGLAARDAEAPSRLAAVPDPAPEAAPRRGVVLGLLSRLGGRPAAGRGGLPAAQAEAEPSGLPAFDSLLAESAEDQELRRKLALGHAGSVR